MILFSISCETCASRLNVRQQAAIGQVLACPKCGSMVQVQPPADWKPPAGQSPPPKPKPPADPNDSQATVETGFANLNSPVERSPIERPKNEVAAPRRVRSNSPTQSAKPATQESNATASLAKEDAGPIMPDGQWTSQAAAKRRKALAWISGILGLCLIGLVGGLYTVSKMMGNSDDTPTKNGTEIAKRVDDPVKGKSAPVVEIDKGGNKKAEPEKAAPEKAGDPVTIDASKADPVDTPADNNPLEVPQVKGNPTSETPETPNDPMDNTNPKDPVDVLDTEGALTTSDPPSAVDGDNDEDSALDILGDLSGLMNPGVDPSEFFQATTDTQSELIGIGKVFVPVPRRLEFDLQVAANEPYPGIMYTDIPLIELLRSLARLTQVPFQLDHQAVALGLIDPYAKVSGKMEDASALGFLNSAIAPLKLKSSWDEHKSVIVVSPQLNDGLQKFEFTPQHLKLGDPKQVESVIASIQRIVRPDSWTTNGGIGTITFADGKFMVEQAGSLAHVTENVIRKLDLATKLTSNPDDAAALEELASTFSKTSELRQSTSAFFNEQNQRAADVLKQLHQDDGVVILMDWVELMQQEWNPNVEIPWMSKELTFAKTLNDLTSSMNLAYRILDDNTFEITSKRKLDLGTRIEIFPCGKQLANGFTEERILALLQTGLGAQMPPQELSYSWVEYVKESQCIVAVLPDTLLITTEKLLEQMLKSE